MTGAAISLEGCRGRRRPLSRLAHARSCIDLDPAGFLDRITMMGMCLISSGLADDRGARRAPAAAHRLDAARAHDAPPPCSAAWRASPTREALGACAASPRCAPTRPAYLQGLWQDAGPRRPDRRRGLSAADDPDGRAPGGRRACPCTASPASSRGSRRCARRARASTSSRTRSCAEAERAPTEDAVAFKSIIAYRTGLDVREWSRDEARAAFERWREDGWRESREHAKPVRDTLLRRTFEVAAAAGGLPDPHPLRRRRPGDRARPRPPAGPVPAAVRAHRTSRCVLIHSGQPWLDEGAYVASILPARLPRHVDHDAVGLARDRPQARGAARHRAHREGALRLGRGERARGAVAVGAARARGARARAGDRAVERRWLDAAQARTIGEGVLARQRTPAARHLSQWVGRQRWPDRDAGRSTRCRGCRSRRASTGRGVWRRRPPIRASRRDRA